MLSSLFESRNKVQKAEQNKVLFALTTKKVQLPKISAPTQQQIQADNIRKAQSKGLILQKKIIQKQKPQSTIFVGNVPLNTNSNELKKHFSKYGNIQKIWFRSIPVQATKMGRKAAHILKQYVQGADAMNAYIRFQNVQQANKATKENGNIFNTLTLRVSLADQKEEDTQSTIFVGNLAHDIKEQQLRQHFQKVGNIKSVRVIKSRQTNMGIGIGYVHFQTKQQMKQAISKLNGTELLGRPVRVKKAVEKQRLNKKEKKIQQKYGKNYKPKNNNKPKNKNQKAIQIRKKGKQIKQKRALTKTKPISK